MRDRARIVESIWDICNHRECWTSFLEDGFAVGLAPINFLKVMLTREAIGQEAHFNLSRVEHCLYENALDH